MKRNVAVTRTVSAGNCSASSLSRTVSTPEDAQLPAAARRHSTAGVRALKWATASARSFGSSLMLETRASKDNLFNIVVTPDSIPQFTIPSLAVQNGLRFGGKDREKQSGRGGVREDVQFGWGNTENQKESFPLGSTSFSLPLSSSSSSSSSSSGFGCSPPLERRAHRSASDPTNSRLPHPRRGNCASLDGQDFPDPATRAAFSLPHLPKVTTPYGFVTLSRSPQMADEEALFLQAGRRRCPKNVDGGAPHPGENLARRTGAAHWPDHSPRPARSSPDRRLSEAVRAEQDIHVSPGRPKSRFWAVLQKRFTNLKEKSQ